ncbi:MAG: beta-lactamase family protein [Draconibacterium sp.]|nr:beta-lactamase family protein [Draconibacterium sp.]
MKKRSFLTAVLIAIVLMQFSCTQTNKTGVGNAALSGDTLKLASEKLQTYIDNGKLGGISALIFKDGETVYRENFGYLNLNEKTPMDETAIFRIFSMTKPITAVALMTLFDEGKFTLDDKVSKYIPEFEGAMVYNAETKTLDPQINELTIRHLLTHTSGIPYGWDQKAYVDSLYRTLSASAWDGTIGEKVKILAKIPLKNQPGTKWEYGLGIDVAGYLVEVISGTPLDVYMKTKIFDPLKMDDTGFFTPEEKHSRLATLCTIKNDTLQEAEGQMKEGFKKPVTLFSGGGGLVSTVDDYLIFCRMLLNGGELDGVRILQESTAQLVMTNQLPDGVVFDENKGYGLAGSVNPETGVYGWAGAASTKFWIDPKTKW